MDQVTLKKVHNQRVELETKVANMEASLAVLKQRLEKVKELEQHDAIDHLEESLNEIDTSYSNIKKFGQLLLADIKDLFTPKN